MEEIKYKIDAIYGSVEPKIFYIRNGDITECYSYSVNYDRNGIEISKTNPSLISTIKFV